MKITKRQLKRIIREEYSRLKRRGLLREMRGGMTQGYSVDYGGGDFIEIMVDGSAPVRKGLCLSMDVPGGELIANDHSEGEFMRMVEVYKPFFAVHFLPGASGSVYAGRDVEGVGFNLIYLGEDISGDEELIRGPVRR